ncbi:MAG: XRE family transcriptional regulator [Candidatus Cryptobacteroides sp.]
MVNKSKNKLREIYESLPSKEVSVRAPKTEFVNKLARLTKSHPTTVRAWIYGAQKPDALKVSIIAKELGVSEKELFN